MDEAYFGGKPVSSSSLTRAETMVKGGGEVFVATSLAYASLDAIPLSKELGLDVDTTSAYLLVIRYLRSTNAHQRL